MFKVLYDPVQEIRELKRQSYSKVLMYLLASALFETIGVLFFAWRFFESKMSQPLLVNCIIGLLFGIILAQLTFAFFFAIGMHVLDGKGRYYDGLATIVLASVAPAVMHFFAGAVAFIPFGIIISVPLVLYGCILGLATFFRAGKEFFEIDYAGVAIGTFITVAPIISVVCAIKYLL